MRKALCAVSLIDVFVEDQANHLRLILVDLQVQHCAVALIDAAFIYRAIAIRNCSAGVMPLLCELPQAGFRADRGFQTLAGGLPVADVVHLNYQRFLGWRRSFSKTKACKFFR